MLYTFISIKYFFVVILWYFLHGQFCNLQRQDYVFLCCLYICYLLVLSYPYIEFPIQIWKGVVTKNILAWILHGLKGKCHFSPLPMLAVGFFRSILSSWGSSLLLICWAFFFYLNGWCILPNAFFWMSVTRWFCFFSPLMWWLKMIIVFHV